MGKHIGKKPEQSGSQMWILLKDDGVYGEFPYARVTCGNVEVAKKLYHVGECNSFGECFTGLVSEEEALRRFKPGTTATGTYDASHQTEDGSFHYADWTNSLHEHVIETDKFGNSVLYVKLHAKGYAVLKSDERNTPDQIMQALDKPAERTEKAAAGVDRPLPDVPSDDVPIDDKELPFH